MRTPVETRDAREALQLALAAPLSFPVLAIDGRSGSGKTELARLAVELAGHAARVLHLEDVYRGWAGLADGLAIAAAAVEALRGGRTASLSTWDWNAGVPGPLNQLPPLRDGELLIVEGCGALAAPLGRHAGAGIWCEAPAEVRAARALARDSYDWSAEWDLWAAQEERLTLERAPDVLLRTG